MILGAGGEARSLAFGMIRQGARVCIANRSWKKGEVLASALGVVFCPLDQVQLNGESIDILINTTPVDMHPDDMPISADALHLHMLVMDIVYHSVTRLLREAVARGCRIVDGVSMFVYQGAMQFEWWTKIDGLVKSQISALRAISQNFTYAKYAAFFDIAQALILNFLQGRPMETFYETIKIQAPLEQMKHAVYTALQNKQGYA